jgi:hypothetical protein
MEMREIGDKQISAQLELRARLQQQLADFERRYGMESGDFYARFERGDLGDAAGFVEWSATYEMVEKLNKRLAPFQV